MGRAAPDGAGGASVLRTGAPVLRFYASAETHSSVDKAVRIAGIGQDNLVKVPTDGRLSMKPGAKPTTRMSGPHSMASERTSPVRAVLATL